MHLLSNSVPATAAIVGLMATVVVATWTDLRARRIPNQLLAPSAAAALMLSVFAPGGQGLAASLLGALTGLLVCLPVYLLKAMAAGDVKLMTVIGLYAGAALTLDIALLAALMGGVWVMLMFQREMRGTGTSARGRGLCLRHRLQHIDADRDDVAGTRTAADHNTHNKNLLIPYGPVIAAGTALALMIASSR